MFEPIEGQNLLANALSVAIFGEVCTLAARVGMADDGGSNPSSSFSGVAPVGGRSPRETHRRDDDVRAALEASNGKRASIPGCDRKWPFDLIYRKRQSHTAVAPLHELKFIVIGSTPGGALIDIPSSVLDDFIVVILPCSRGTQKWIPCLLSGILSIVW